MNRFLIKVVFFLCVSSLRIGEIDSSFSSTAIKRAKARSQSMSAISYNKDFQPITRAQPTSISSSSSISVHSDVKTNPNQIGSTSAFEEIDLRREPLVERSKHVSFSSADLREATAVTSGVRLDPTRDGVFARLRQILYRNAAPIVAGAAVGGVIGGGGVVATFDIFNITNTTQKPIIPLESESEGFAIKIE